MWERMNHRGIRQEVVEGTKNCFQEENCLLNRELKIRMGNCRLGWRTVGESRIMGESGDL